MPIDVDNSFKIDIRQSITLPELRRLLNQDHCVRTLTRYIVDGRRNKYTREIIPLPAVRGPNKSWLTTMGAWEHFVRELNRKEPLEVKEQ